MIIIFNNNSWSCKIILQHKLLGCSRWYIVVWSRSFNCSSIHFAYTWYSLCSDDYSWRWEYHCYDIFIQKYQCMQSTENIHDFFRSSSPCNFVWDFQIYGKLFINSVCFGRFALLACHKSYRFSGNFCANLHRFTSLNEHRFFIQRSANSYCLNSDKFFSFFSLIYSWWQQWLHVSVILHHVKSLQFLHHQRNYSLLHHCFQL